MNCPAGCFKFLSPIVLLIAVLCGCRAQTPTHQTPTAVSQQISLPQSQPASAPATSQSVDEFPTTTNPRETLPFLASDALAGRLPGSPGLQKAGDFLAAEFRRIGLKPLPGQPDYFQTFSMNEASSLAPSTCLALNGEKLALAKDFDPMSLSAEKSFAGKIVFAGFGITRDANDPSHYDDYAGIDAHGKIVLAMMKEPLDDKGASRFARGQGQWSNSALFALKAKNAADHGAVALLLVAPPSSGGADIVNPYSGNGRGSSPIPVIQITRRVANLLLSMGGAADLKSLQDAIYNSFKPHSVDLNDLEITGDVEIIRTQIQVRNVMAYLPGAGPHADEWVVVGAHYDHLGRGQLGHMMGGKVGSIWHGADDNASGTSAVIELADKMKHGPPLPRSVLFIFFTAEEEGLIGSDHFVNNPLIPMDHVIAMLNLDMVGRLRSNALQIGGAGTAANFDAIVASAIVGTGLTTSTALPDDGGRGGMGPSDHMSFAQHKIPVLFLFTGMHADYHRPTDTADKINYAGIDTLVDVSEKIVDSMTLMPRQQYNATNDDNTMTHILSGSGGHRAVLGVIPDDSAAETTTGVAISGVLSGGPAETAGLKAGDVIVAFNAKPMKTLGDLSESLDEAHGGDKVMVKVVRDGKQLELHATLADH
jgi:hypothetical protein